MSTIIKKLQVALEDQANEILSQEEYTSEEEAFADGLRCAQRLLANLIEEENTQDAISLS